MKALHVEALEKAVRLPGGQELSILRGVDLDVAAGTTTAIVGPSGSGKTTLLSILGLLARPDRGSVAIAGLDTAELADRELAEIRGEHIGFVFQNYGLLPYMTVSQNVQLPLEQRGIATGRARRKRAAAALEAVGLGDRLDAVPRELSGGEKQRVAIARALVNDPELVIADEPTGAVDIETSHLVLDQMFAVVAERGAALVMVTHDPAVAALADRIHHLEDGVLREVQGAGGDPLANEPERDGAVPC